MPRPPIDPSKREAIVAALRAGPETSCRGLARQFGVSDATVRSIAKDAGLAGVFSRAQTEKATQAAMIDNAAVRAATSRRWLGMTNKLLDWTEDPAQLPGSASDVKNLLTAAAIAFDKHLKAELFDGEHEGLAAVDAWLRGVTGDP